MMVIDDDDAQRLLERYEREGDDGDPLDLRLRSGDTWRSVQAVAGRMLSGETTTPSTAPTMPMERVEATLLASLGLHPRVLAALADAARGMGVNGTHRGAVIRVDASPAIGHVASSITVAITPIIWNGRNLLVPSMPETLITAINAASARDQPMSLDAVVDHPGVRALCAQEEGLHILDAEATRDGVTLLLDNAVMSPLSHDQMEAIWVARPH